MYRLRTFGGLTLERDGEPCTGAATQRRRLALLALLAASGGREVSRDKLVAYLWPEAEPARARHSLDDALSALRRELRDDGLFLGVASLRLNRDVLTSDVAEFNDAVRAGELQRAASLYGGPFLDGFHLSGAPELERWIDGERDAAAAAYARALATLAARAEESGNAADAVRHWRALVVHDPLHGRNTLRLMRALAAAGERAEALRVARVHEAMVGEQLGGAVDAEVSSYAEALRRADVVRPATERPGPPRVAVAAPSAEGLAGEPGAGAASPVPGVATPPAAPAPIYRATPIALMKPAEGAIDAAAAARAARDATRTVVVDSDRRRRRRWLSAAGAGAVVVAAALAVAAAVRAREVHQASPGVSALDPHRVAILPFENATGDAHFDAVGSLVADAIASGLTESGFATVASAPSALASASGRASPAQTVAPEVEARRLRAGTVITGVVYRIGDNLRFQARVTDASRGEVRRVLEPVVGSTRDVEGSVSRVRDQVLGSLAAQFDVRLASWARLTKSPPTYEAYREFVAGRAAWPDHRRALAHFDRAAEIDSTYDLARIQAATAYKQLDNCAATDSLGRRVLAHRDRLAPFDAMYLDAVLAGCRGDNEGYRRASLELRRLAPSSPNASYNYLLALVYQGQLDSALAMLNEFSIDAWSTEMGPTSVALRLTVLHFLGRHALESQVAAYGLRRFPEEPLMQRGRLLALSPGGSRDAVLAAADTFLATVPRVRAPVIDWLDRSVADLRVHGRPDVAQDVARRAVAFMALVPEGERSSAAFWHDMGVVSYDAGNWRESLAAFVRCVAAGDTSITAQGWLAVAAIRAGDRAAADRAVASLERDHGPYAARQHYWLARAAALRGDRRRAADELAQMFAHDNALDFVVYVGHLRADLDSLRGFPPAEALLRPKP